MLVWFIIDLNERCTVCINNIKQLKVFKKNPIYLYGYGMYM